MAVYVVNINKMESSTQERKPYKMKWNPNKINDSNEKCGMQGEINMWNFVLTEEIQILVST